MGDLSTPSGDRLLKHDSADRLRMETMNGTLRSGKRNVEGRLATKLNFAHASITESR